MSPLLYQLSYTATRVRLEASLHLRLPTEYVKDATQDRAHPSERRTISRL